MTREEAKELLPLIQGYAEGKTIQFLKIDGTWRDMTEPNFSSPANYYRIKPEPKYRPFKNAEECWNEMKKHQPFGWIKDKEDGHYSMVTTVDAAQGDKHISISGDYLCSLDETMSLYTFADGAPFGVKIKEDKQ
jgi:hypothetical protein